MPRYNVRCSQDASKILGTIELSGRGEKHRISVLPDKMVGFTTVDGPSDWSRIESYTIELREVIVDCRTEMAVYSERPIQFWRRLSEFIESEPGKVVAA